MKTELIFITVTSAHLISKQVGVPDSHTINVIRSVKLGQDLFFHIHQDEHRTMM